MKIKKKTSKYNKNKGNIIKKCNKVNKIRKMKK